MNFEEKQEKFTEICEKILQEEKENNGIGTLKEKTVHAVVKNYFEPRKEFQEVRIGRQVADILNEKGIYEIQTRSFNALRKKLEHFLELGRVTIVYPIPCEKWISWIDTDTGEMTKLRKSPKVGQANLAFYELYKIKQYLKNKNLNLIFLLIDMEEYRCLNGWSADKKRGSTRYDRIPKKLREEVCIETIEDYKKLLPKELPKQFTVKDYQKVGKLSLRQSQLAVHVLHFLGVLERVGKKGNAYIYKEANIEKK